MFGKVLRDAADETTPFYPRSPYGVAKAYATGYGQLPRGVRPVRVLDSLQPRSPRRGLKFVTRKITRGAAAIKRVCRTNYIWKP